VVGVRACFDDTYAELACGKPHGVEMCLPSVLEARVQRVGGEVVGVWIGGSSVQVAEGTIEV
jgi:predicted PhzF superfamily epimerase YddE/YHI9